MEIKIKLIERYLKKKKEKIFLNLIVRKYDNVNFYMAFVYNMRIKMYKMVFVPLDIMDEGNIDDYVCYQFVKVQYADYLLDIIRDYKHVYKNIEFRNRLNTNMDNYQIEMNLYHENLEYKFLATRYIPKDWDFLYEAIMVMFDHLPHIVNELCTEMLSVLNNNLVVDYQLSYNFDLYKGEYSDIFDEHIISEGEKLYKDKEVKFLECVNNKYYGIVDDTIVIVEYNNRKKILNLYCNGEVDRVKIYAVLLGIIDEKFKKFYKVMVNKNGDVSYYLCYGVVDDFVKVIYGSDEKLLDIDMFKDGTLKILEDYKGQLEEAVIKRLGSIYSRKEVDEIAKNIKVDV